MGKAGWKGAQRAGEAYLCVVGCVHQPLTLASPLSCPSFLLKSYQAW